MSDDIWSEARMVAMVQEVIVVSTARRLFPREQLELREHLVKAVRAVTCDLRGQLSAAYADLARAQAKLAYYEQPLLSVNSDVSYDHRFTDDGWCVRCGEDAEEWDAGCVEEIVRDFAAAVRPEFISALKQLIARARTYGDPPIDYDALDVARCHLERIEKYSAEFDWEAMDARAARQAQKQASRKETQDDDIFGL